MSSDELDRTIQRIIDRANPKGLQRALKNGRLPRSVERTLQREAGYSTSPPAEMELLAREASPAPSSSDDMRSELVRRMIQMETLDAAKGLSRSADDDGGGEGGGDGGGEGGMEGSALDEWWKQMKALGLNKSEIEEHLIARLRAIRREHYGSHEVRRLRRK